LSCLIGTFLLNSCGKITRVVPQDTNKGEVVVLNETADIQSQRILVELKESMILYREMAGHPYSEKDIEQVLVILNDYLNSMSDTHSKTVGMEVIQKTIERINILNEQCEFSLIATGEREKIADVINLVSIEKGYSLPEDDVTEAWRDW